MDTNNSYPPPPKKIIIYLVYQFIANLELLYGWDWDYLHEAIIAKQKKVKLEPQ